MKTIAALSGCAADPAVDVQAVIDSRPRGSSWSLCLGLTVRRSFLSRPVHASVCLSQGEASRYIFLNKFRKFLQENASNRGVRTPDDF